MLVEAYSARQVLAAFDAGADAYLLKSVSCEVLLKTLDLVLLGETVFPAKTLGTLRNKGLAIGIGSADVLSERERAIIRCIVAGDPNKLIARKLDIAETTVKVHLRAILRKICVKNQTQAAVWGMRHLPPDDGPAEEVEAAC
nr:response regulator transcription factor [Microvirga zambiensis]